MRAGIRKSRSFNELVIVRMAEGRVQLIVVEVRIKDRAEFKLIKLFSRRKFFGRLYECERNLLDVKIVELLRRRRERVGGYPSVLKLVGFVRMLVQVLLQL